MSGHLYFQDFFSNSTKKLKSASQRYTCVYIEARQYNFKLKGYVLAWSSLFFIIILIITGLMSKSVSLSNSVFCIFKQLNHIKQRHRDNLLGLGLTRNVIQ